MIFSSRKTIGLFLSKDFEYFDNACFRLLEREGKRLNYDIMVFATVGYQITDSVYDTQEKNLFAFAPVEKLDGILIVPGSFERGGFRDLLYNTLRQRATCPIVAIRYDSGEYDCSFTDENLSIRQILRHLVEDHGLKKICFQTGFPGHTECEMREAAFRQAMAEYGLPVPDSAVCPGTMTTDCGEQAYQAFFSDPDNRPEAVVCGNDYMAFGLVRALQAHGVRVPEEVIVTGFDNESTRGLDVLSLTTIQPDYETVIAGAIRMLDQKIRGLPGPHRLPVPGVLVKGESCGCGCRPAEYFRETTQRIVAKMEDQNRQVQKMNRLSIDLSACDSLDDLHRVVIQHWSDLSFVRDYYLCLFGTAGHFSRGLQEQACLTLAIRDHRDCGMPMINFDSARLLPDMCDDRNESQMLFVKLLHQQDSLYGYAMIRYEHGNTPSGFYVQRNVLLSSALQNIHKREEMQALYEERRRSSITDLMTGLLNRRGFFEKLEPLWPGLRGDRVTFVCIDLDHLKQINDTYGHAAGDFAIRLVGQAIRETLEDGCAAARIGGDEFVLFLPGSRSERYPALFEKKLEALNRLENRTFSVTASAGSISVVPDVYLTIEQCLQLGDEAMYQVKEDHHRISRKEDQT